MCGNRRSRLQGKNGVMAAGKTCGDDEQFDLAAWFPSLKYRIMELVYIYAVMSLLALVGIIWLQIKMRKDKQGIL